MASKCDKHAPFCLWHQIRGAALRVTAGGALHADHCIRPESCILWLPPPESLSSTTPSVTRYAGRLESHVLIERCSVLIVAAYFAGQSLTLWCCYDDHRRAPCPHGKSMNRMPLSVRVFGRVAQHGKQFTRVGKLRQRTQPPCAITRLNLLTGSPNCSCRGRYAPSRPMWCERLVEGSKGFRVPDITPCLLTVHYFLVQLSLLGISNTYAKSMTLLIASHNILCCS